MPVRNAKKKTEPAVKYHNSVNTGIDSKPLPLQYGGTTFTSMGGYKYFPFLAPDDNLFRSLLEIRLLSPTQSNCISDKTFYSVGDGLNIIDQEFPKDFDRKINGKNQTIDDVLKAVFESFFQDGNKFIEVVRTEVGGKKYVHCYPHNNLDCRIEEPKEGYDPTHVIRSREFRRDGIYYWKANDKEKPVRIPIWSDNILQQGEVWVKDKEKKGVTRTMLVIKNEIQGIEPYGLPSNFSGFLQALLEYKMARFNMDNFENNMFVAGLLSIMGQLSPEEGKKLLKDIRRTHMGEGKQQRVFVVSSEQGINDTKFEPFTQSHEGHFVEFDKHNIDKIISANSWSKDLMDLKEGSGLGKGGAFLSQLFKIKFRTVIMPAQQIVLNNFIFPLMKIMDEYKATSFYDQKWFIKPVIPVSLEGILDINSLLTVDEGRKELGKPELNGELGKKMISEVGVKQKQTKNEGGAA